MCITNERNGLTITIVMRAESANYGESIGNIAILKKVSRGDHNQYSYISRQALRYNIIQQLGWNETPVCGQGKGVVQFDPSAQIDQYPEIDLFGYMKTKSGKKGKRTEQKGQSNADGEESDSDENNKVTTRSAVARLSNAIALEPFNGDFDYLTNMGLARRVTGLTNTIIQSEIQASYYTYTLSVDLDLVGEDKNITEDKWIDSKEKASRVEKLLNAVQFLYRDIRGRRENLAPLFVIGGVYERKNPYFEHRVTVRNNEVVITPIMQTKNSCTDARTHTYCGFLSDIFANSEEIKKQLEATTVYEFFDSLMRDVRGYYGVSDEQGDHDN